MSSGLLNCFDHVIAERVIRVCVCVCVSIKSIGGPGSLLLPAQGAD